MVAVAAKPGGQEGADGEAEGLAEGGGDAIGLVDLVATLKRMIEVPKRDPDVALTLALAVALTLALAVALTLALNRALTALQLRCLSATQTGRCTSRSTTASRSRVRAQSSRARCSWAASP